MLFKPLKIPTVEKHLFGLICLLALTCAALADEEKIQLKFPNAPVGEVLVYYGHLIGKQIVCDNSVQGQISVVSDGPVSPAQAAEMLETALSMNGFALVDGPGGNVVKVLGLGKSALLEGVPIYASADELPKNQRVVSLTVKLRHLAALEAAGFLSQYIPPSALVGFTPNPSARVIVVTGPTNIVRNALKVLDTVDVSRDPVAPREAAEPPPERKPVRMAPANP